MRERLSLEWKTPITIRTQPRSIALSDELERAILLMTHEAIVNALKHAHASRISVDVRLEADTVTIAVADDGRGFNFKGRYDHAALTRIEPRPEQSAGTRHGAGRPDDDRIDGYRIARRDQGAGRGGGA